MTRNAVWLVLVVLLWPIFAAGVLWRLSCLAWSWGLDVADDFMRWVEK